MPERLSRLWATKTKDDEWWSSFVTSPLAIVLNYLVVDFPWLTPNRITLLSFLTAITSAALVVAGGGENFIVAAVLIHFSHVLDCMDGQMARYRGTSSTAGAFYDKLTDQIQVTLWFGAVAYAAHQQSGDVLPIFLAFAGVAFYSLRGYIKYVSICTEVSLDDGYMKRIAAEDALARRPDSAGLGFGLMANLRWFVGEQRKVLRFNEGVFIFMLSFSLVTNLLTEMLWVFAVSQVSWGLARCIQRGYQFETRTITHVEK